MALNFRLSTFGRANHRGTSDFSRHQAAALWQALISDTRGATAIEYGLLAGLIAVGLAGGLGALADLVNLLFEVIGDETADVTDSITNP